MMSAVFSYWEHGDSVSVDCENDAVLTPEEAMVIATLKVAEEASEIVSVLKDILYFMQNHMGKEDD